MSLPSSLSITFVDAAGERRALQVQPGRSVMESALENDVRGILADCGGCCSCATCHCYLDQPWSALFPTPSEQETELVSYAFDPLPNSRLSCQLILRPEHDGIVIGLPKRQI